MINRNINKILLARDITYGELAEALGCSLEYICAIFEGYEPSIYTDFIERMAEYLGVSVEYLTMNEWSSREVEVLKNLYSDSAMFELEKALPKKTQDDIKSKAEEIGLKRSKHPRIYISGYLKIYKPEHHRANANGYVLEHIVVFEEANNTRIPDGYHIHHIDGNKTNNIPSNLMLLSASAHMKLHQDERAEERRAKQQGRETKIKLMQKIIDAHLSENELRELNRYANDLLYTEGYKKRKCWWEEGYEEPESDKSLDWYLLQIAKREISTTNNSKE